MSHEFKPYDAPHLAGVCCVCGDFHSVWSPEEVAHWSAQRVRVESHKCPTCGEPVLDLGDLNLSPSDMDFQDADSMNICATCGATLAL